MPTNKFRIIIWAVLLGSQLSLRAQQTPLDTSAVLANYAYFLKYHTAWKNTGNAAGLMKDSLLNFGKTAAGYQQIDGSYKLSQQAQKVQQLRFDTERYLYLGKTLFYGRFGYAQQWEKAVRMNDVMDPYRGTPYLLADSIGGDWKKQLYTLEVKASSPALFNQKIHVGLSAALDVGTGSRQNDPRPLSTNNQIKVMPALVWNVSKQHALGINASYQRYREDVSLETKNTNINHRLYKFLGLGQLELPTTFTTSTSRVYEGNNWGGNLQYQLKGRHLNWLTELGYRSGAEKILEGSSLPRKSGTWKQKAYTLNSTFLIEQPTLQHRIGVKLSRLEDTGVEFHEFYNTSTKTWQTLLEADFYLAQTDQAQLSYTIIKPTSKLEMSWLAELGINYLSLSKNYLIPASHQEISNAELWIKGLKNFSINKGSSLMAGIKAGYGKNLSQSLNYLPITADRTLAAKEVLYPDHGYLSTDYLTLSAQAQYNFKLKKAPGTQFFAQINYSNVHSLTVPLYGTAQGNRNFINLSLGAFY